jgi:patatin-like phospholipase/acyl hydrolase
MGLVRPAFRPQELSKMLLQVLGEMKMGDATNRLCVPSCEGRFGDVNVFKTPHHPDFKLDWKLPMAEVGKATSAAPTFLPAHLFGEYIYVDGGLWANNPAMVAVVDALSCYDLDPRQIRLFSIGTGSRVPALKKRQLSLGGLLSWALDGTLSDSIMHYGSLNATGQAGLLMGRDRLTRAEPTGDDALVHMTDYASAMKLLVPAGQNAAGWVSAAIGDFFFQVPADTPTFFHGPRGVDTPDWAPER